MDGTKHRNNVYFMTKDSLFDREVSILDMSKDSDFISKLYLKYNLNGNSQSIPQL